MGQDHQFMRRVPMSTDEAALAWSHPQLLRAWLLPQVDDLVIDAVRMDRGDTYSVHSRSLGFCVHGVCLDQSRHGFDLTWRVEADGFPQQHHDILSVRLLPLAQGCQVVLTYSAADELVEQLTRFWAAALDRLAGLARTPLRHRVA